ncbi:MAG: pyridoxamine 5'-phosphate oxidase, partial [Gelidibacter sp.]|nr:pyridoxamine 5'-phosphate oxidase [Gelidibacter sp.]
MESDLSNYRRNYQKSELSEEGITDNPMELFQKWF